MHKYVKTKQNVRDKVGPLEYSTRNIIFFMDTSVHCLPERRY